MAFYDYYCEANGQTVEVQHSMTEKLKTWGEVCRLAGIDPGKPPKNTKVIRLVNDITPTVFRVKGLDKDDYGTRLR
ncbi:MAG: hypothetical protein KAR05_07295 [Candidatus Omnitrophica bacterium]|nr:hypothetical protein [Candidatus Omnitrophota bacterium]